ncbi:MAG: hypothetical protein KUL83_10450 [Lentimicrobium sp.]|jgi:hypothetical protein|nr:hypothetical protein [Lentimicrobium sp.]MDD2527610.1 hypothetical protein [Lentimicrobiaceae bacterium]MDY0024519.1 hypothetical protein [Lentimicrobium sp.]
MNPAQNLSPFDAKESLIQQTIAQINRDFARFGMEINFPQSMEMVYAQVFSEIIYYLNDLLATDNHRLVSLLYHIDISESAIKEAWAEQPDLTRPHILSELIILREFKKVVYRNHYRDKKDTIKKAR